MPKAPAPITAPKIRKLAAKAFKSPSMLTTEETRELGGSVLAHIEQRGIEATKTVAKTPAKKKPAKKTTAKQL